jgi:hypothetical protein
MDQHQQHHYLSFCAKVSLLHDSTYLLMECSDDLNSHVGPINGCSGQGFGLR